MADDGLQLNLDYQGDDAPRERHLDWRERKRQARERQLQRRQRGRGGRQQGGAGSAGGGGGQPPRQAAAGAAQRPAHKQQTQLPHGHAAAPRAAAADPLHGYGAALQQQAPAAAPASAAAAVVAAKQQQQQQQQMKQRRPAAAAATAATAAAAAGAKHKVASAAPGSRPAKRPNLADAAAAAEGAAAAITAAEEADILDLVRLNMTHEQRIQEEEGGAQEAAQGFVEFGDAPDEPELAALAAATGRSLRHDDRQHGKGKKQQQQQQQQQRQQKDAAAAQQQQPLVQHRVGEMAHAEPNVPEDQRAQLFGDDGGAAGGAGDAGWPGLGLCEVLAAHLSALNFQEPTQVQKRAIPLLLAGRDALVRSSTGSGKTLAYLAPIVDMLQAQQPRVTRADGTLALVLVPTRELAVQVSDVLTALVRRFCWLVPGILIGGEHRGHEKARLRKGVTVLVATPGRLLDHLQNTSSFRVDRLRFLVLDEADRLLDLGFEQKLAAILGALAERAAAAADNSRDPAAGAPRRQTVLLSATLHQRLSALAGLSLREPVGVGCDARAAGGGHLELGEQDGAPGSEGAARRREAGEQEEGKHSKFELPQQLRQKYVEVPAKMRLVVLLGLLRSRLRRSKAAKMVVFFSNCDSVDFHHRLLLQHGQQQRGGDGDSDSNGAGGAGGGSALAEPLLGGCPVLKLHGDMRQPERTSSLVSFAKAGTCVLLCTDVAARGLDFPAVTTIVQYDPAGDPAEYVHRVGRTARMGQQGEALLFLLPSEVPYAELLQQQGPALSREAAGALLQCLPGLAGPGGAPSARVQQLGRRLGQGGGGGGGDADAADALAGARPEQQAAALLLQRQLVAAVSADAELTRMALSAFRSFVRAYATHPSALKHIFHIKSLHLGHLAASFGLREAPAKIGASGSASERKKRKLKGKKAEAKRQKAAWHRTARAAEAQAH